MKRGKDNRFTWSPSDFGTYLESPFAVWMQRMYLEGVAGVEPDQVSADLRLIQQQGKLHEARYVANLKALGCDFAEIEQFGADPREQTRAAILEGHGWPRDGRAARGLEGLGDADGIDGDVVRLAGLCGGRGFPQAIVVERAGAAAFHLLEVAARFHIAHEEQAF